MQIKQKSGFAGKSKNIIEHILRSRGISQENIPKFLFPDSSLKADYRKLDNIDEVVEKLHEHIEKGSHIRVTVDFDADGFTSAAIIYQFIKEDLGHDNISKYIPETKVHGINVDDTLENDVDLLFVTDAGSSNFKEHRILKERGIDVVIIDHHLVTDNVYSNNAIVVNNQLSDAFPWKALTGAPMTLLFCEAYCDQYNLDIDLSRYDCLAAVGLISDRAILTDTGAFYMAHKGLNNIQNPLLKEMIGTDDRDKLESITPTDVEWKIAPQINAMTRTGKPERVKLVVDALANDSYNVYNSRLESDFSVVEEAVRAMRTTRSNQSSKVKTAIEQIEERIQELGTDKHQILLVNVTGITDNTGLNGLIAIKLASQYKRPTLVMSYNENKEMMTGSGRNFSESPLENFKDTLEESGLFEYVAGHQSAFGFGITVDNAIELIDTFNETLSDIEYDNLTHHVDICYEGQPDAQEIMDIASHEHLWGNGIERPLIYLSDVKIKKSDIKFLKGNTLKFSAGIVDCIMFKITEEQKLSLTMNNSETVSINLVGEASVNEFRGQRKPQIMITDFEVKEVNEDDPWENFNFDVDGLPF